jgi:hypothetical protein
MNNLNFTIFAQNSNFDYIQQACLAAMSIHQTNPGSNICLITNDSVPKKYQDLFEHVVPIPFGDKSKKSTWKVENRWKIYHATPYEETAVIDSDMLVLDNLQHWKSTLDNYDLYYTNKVQTYRGDWADNTYYRKSFRNHKLPDLYAGFHWFKRCEFSHNFYKWLELVMNNWELFYGQYAGGKYFQNFPSIDVSSAIVTKILQCEDKITSNTTYPTFTHMKLKCQGWDKIYVDTWQEQIGTYLDNDCNLKIGNFRQSGIFHYTEKSFCNQQVIQTYENKLGISNG